MWLLSCRLIVSQAEGSCKNRSCRPITGGSIGSKSETFTAAKLLSSQERVRFSQALISYAQKK